nr:Hpt domain-containing protein [Saccharofermentans sp.]
DEEFYKSLLLQFSSEAKEKIPLIQKYFRTSDWHNYEILVHALKSTSKMIGAADLSEKARDLEKAASDKKEDFISDNHEELIKDYSRLSAEINEQFGVKENDDEDEIFEFVPESGEENGGVEA